MGVLLVVGVPGAPGATTCCLGWTLTWPRDVLLADCEAQPAQTIQAGYLRGTDHEGRGLAALARAYRESRPLGAEILQQTIDLKAASSPMRRLLPGFTKPSALRLFEPVWPSLGEAFAELDAQAIDVIVDAGRVGIDGVPLGLLAAADAVCLVTRSSLRSLAAARLYLPVLTDQFERLNSPPPLGLILVAPHRPYTAREITTQFGIRCWAEIGWQPREAAVFSDGAPEPRKFAAGTLLNSYRTTGQRLHEKIARDRAATDSLLFGVTNG